MIFAIVPVRRRARVVKIDDVVIVKLGLLCECSIWISLYLTVIEELENDNLLMQLSDTLYLFNDRISPISMRGTPAN